MRINAAKTTCNSHRDLLRHFHHSVAAARLVAGMLDNLSMKAHLVREDYRVCLAVEQMAAAALAADVANEAYSSSLRCLVVWDIRC